MPMFREGTRERRPISSDPIWRIMTEEGRRMDWLARAAGVSTALIVKVKYMERRATPTFRARCSAALGRKEAELFLAESPKRHGELVGR